jgi:hypothetical protein
MAARASIAAVNEAGERDRLAAEVKQLQVMLTT